MDPIMLRTRMCYSSIPQQTISLFENEVPMEKKKNHISMILRQARGREHAWEQHVTGTSCLQGSCANDFPVGGTGEEVLSPDSSEIGSWKTWAPKLIFLPD